MSITPGQVQQKYLEDLFKQSMTGGAVQAGYLVSETKDLALPQSSDSASVSNSPASGTNSNSAPKTNSNDSNSNYVDNTDQNQNSGQPTNIGSYGDKIWEDVLTEFNTGGLTEGMGDDEFGSLNRGKLEQLFNMLRAMANLNSILAQTEDTREEMMENLAETLIESRQDAQSRSKITWSEGVTKSNKTTMQYFQKGVLMLEKKVQEHNDQVYKKKEEEAKAWHNSGWDEFVNWITINSKQKDEDEKMKKLNEDYEAAKQKNLQTLNQMKGLAQGITSDMSKIGDSITDDLFGFDDDNKYSDNKYIDMNDSARRMNDLRSFMTSFANANRIYAQALSAKEDARAAMDEALSGKKSGGNKFKALEETVEAEANNMQALFDRVSNDILNAQKMRNNIRHYELQIEKYNKGFLSRLFSKICAALATVAAFIPGVGPFIAAGLGALAAGLDHLGNVQADSVNDAYTPSVVNEYSSNPNPGISSSIGGRLENIKRNGLGEVGFGQMNQTEEGFYQINHAELAQLQRQLDSVNAAFSIIQKGISKRGAMLNALHRATTELQGAGGSDDLIEAAAEAIIAQSGTEYSTLTFQLSEYKQAYNTERQQQIMMEKATKSFWINMPLSLASGVAGAAGGAIGQAVQMGCSLGGSIGDYVMADQDAAHSMSQYEVNTSAFKSGQKESVSKSIGQRLDSIEYEIFSQLLSEDSICDIGDGKFGLNADKITDLQTRFMRLMNTLSVLTSSAETKAEMLNAVADAYGYTTVSDASSMGKVSKLFESGLKTFTSLKKVLQEKVDVKNRIADAQESYSVARTKMWVKVGISSATTAYALGASMAGSISIGMVGFVFFVGNLAMQTFDHIYNMVHSFLKSQTGYGKLSHYTVRESNKAKKEAAEKLSRATDIESTEEKIGSRLDQMEANLYLDGSLLEDTASGSIGISSGEMAKVNLELTKANRTKQILSGALKQIQTIHAMLNRINSKVRYAGTSNLSAIEIASYQSNVMLEAVLQTQMEALQTVVSRHNECRAALRQGIMASVKFGIFVAEQIASVIKELKVLRADELQAKQNARTITPSEKIELKKLKFELNNQTKLDRILDYSLPLLKSMVDWAVGAIVDAAMDKSEATEAKKEEISKQKKALKNENKDAKTANFESFARSLDTMETSAFYDQLIMGQDELKIQDINTKSASAKEFNKSLQNLIEEGAYSNARLMKYLISDKRTAQIFHLEKEKIRKLVAEKKNEYELAAGRLQNLMVEAQKAQTQLARLDLDQQQKSQSSKILLDRADQIASAAGEMAKKAEELAASEQKISDLRTSREKTVKHKTDPLKSSEDPATPQVEDPDKGALKSKDDIDHEIKEIHDLSKKIKENKNPQEASRMLKELKAKTAKLDQSISASKMYADLSEAMVEAGRADGIQERIDKEMEKEVLDITKDKDGKVDLEKLNSDQLKDLYAKLYKSVFKPASQNLQRLRKERMGLQKQISAINAEIAALPQESEKRLEKIKEKETLELRLAENQEWEGLARQEIQGYNRSIGVINKLYKEKTHKDLDPIKETESPIPIASAPAEHKPAQTEAPADAALTAKTAKKPETSDTNKTLAELRTTAHAFSLISDLVAETNKKVVTLTSNPILPADLKVKSMELQKQAKELESALVQLREFDKKMKEIEELEKGIKRYEKGSGNEKKAASQMQSLLSEKVKKLSEIRGAFEKGCKEIEDKRKKLDKALDELINQIKAFDASKTKAENPPAPNPLAKTPLAPVSKVSPKKEKKVEVAATGSVFKSEIKAPTYRSQAEEAQLAQKKLAALAACRNFGNV